MDTLVSDYIRSLKRKSDYKNHPMVHQYNPLKIALLIYKVCWQIQRQKIYQLTAKCQLLQKYLVEAMHKYVNSNANILVI